MESDTPPSYQLNPKKCLHCKCNIPYRQRKNKYCSHSCAAKAINPTRSIVNRCLCCEVLVASWRQFCSHKCRAQYNKQVLLKQWKSGLDCGWSGQSVQIKSVIREYLLEKVGKRCIKCKWGEVHSVTKKSPLQIHHKDGDATNCVESNLQVLCPNCHSLTENFGNQNKKATRKSRYAPKP